MSISAHNAANQDRPAIPNYRDLIVWSRSMDLVEDCYKISRQFPQSEIYGLTSQIRRAAVSNPANIAEGHGRRNLGDYIYHLSIANGSLKELETHLIIAGRLKYIADNQIVPTMEACAEVGRMLIVLIQKLQQREGRPYHLQPVRPKLPLSIHTEVLRQDQALPLSLPGKCRRKDQRSLTLKPLEVPPTAARRKEASVGIY